MTQSSGIQIPIDVTLESLPSPSLPGRLHSQPRNNICNRDEQTHHGHRRGAARWLTPRVELHDSQQEDQPWGHNVHERSAVRLCTHNDGGHYGDRRGDVQPDLNGLLKTKHSRA